MADDYEVGYGRPPKQTRFRKGQSGNLMGRPRGSTDVQSEMKRLLAAKTKIKVNGAIETVPTSKALCLALVQKAMSGDVRAFSKIVEIAGPEMADELRATAGDVTSADLALVGRALQRKGEQTPGSPIASTVNSPAKDNES